MSKQISARAVGWVVMYSAIHSSSASEHFSNKSEKDCLDKFLREHPGDKKMISSGLVYVECVYVEEE